MKHLLTPEIIGAAALLVWSLITFVQVKAGIKGRFYKMPVMLSLAPHDLKTMNTTKLCQLFADWMRQNDQYGYWLVPEIDKNMARFCRTHNLVKPDPNTARSILVELPGILKERARLNQRPELYSVKQRTKNPRPILYRISSTREMENTLKNQHIEVQLTSCPEIDRTARTATGIEAGHGVATARKNVSRSKAKKNRLIAAKKKPTKRAHYLDGCPLAEAA